MTTTPHWPAIGLGSTLADAQASVKTAKQLIATGQTLDVSSLTQAAQLAPEIVTAAASQAYAQFSSAAQAQWDQATSTKANDARVSAGIEATASLIDHGYNPDSPEDNQKVIIAVAGAVSLIPGVGPILGGALLILDAVGQAIAKLLQQVGLIWFGCRTSGNWTVETVWATENDYLSAIQGASYKVPGAPVGSFAAMVLPMLAADAVQRANCKGGLGNLAIVAAAANAWNAGASGPPMFIYVPSLVDDGTERIFASGSFDSARQVPMAFTTLTPTQVAESKLVPWMNAIGTTNSGSLAIAAQNLHPFIIQLKGSTYTPPAVTAANAAAAAAAASAASAAAVKKVAIGAVAVTGGALVGTAIYSAASGKAVGTVFGGIWRGVKGIFR